jgi:hypothetical protein
MSLGVNAEKRVLTTGEYFNHSTNGTVLSTQQDLILSATTGASLMASSGNVQVEDQLFSGSFSKVARNVSEIAVSGTTTAYTASDVASGFIHFTDNGTTLAVTVSNPTSEAIKTALSAIHLPTDESSGTVNLWHGDLVVWNTTNQTITFTPAEIVTPPPNLAGTSLPHAGVGYMKIGQTTTGSIQLYAYAGDWA